MAKLVEECRGVLKVYSDGKTERSDQPAVPHPCENDERVKWKDVTFDPSLGLELRIYIPISSTSNYRLAPENRLPSAIDDGFTALRWIYSQSENLTENWLSGADFGRVFVSGDSSGGGIVHHVAVRAAAAESTWGRMKIKGCVLLNPGFGGVERTLSEATCPPEAFLSLELYDRYWRLALPVGADRDYPVVNPFGPGAPCLKEVELPAMVVVVGGSDMLRDRQIEYAEKLKGYGKEVELVVFEAEQHDFFTLTPTSAASAQLVECIRRFLISHP